MSATYTTDRDIHDMVVQTLEAGDGAEDFDIDAIVGDLKAAATYNGREFVDLPEGDEFWTIVARHDTTTQEAPAPTANTAPAATTATGPVYAFKIVDRDSTIDYRTARTARVIFTAMVSTAKASLTRMVPVRDLHWQNTWAFTIDSDTPGDSVLWYVTRWEDRVNTDEPYGIRITRESWSDFQAGDEKFWDETELAEVMYQLAIDLDM